MRRPALYSRRPEVIEPEPQSFVAAVGTHVKPAAPTASGFQHQQKRALTSLRLDNMALLWCATGLLALMLATLLASTLWGGWQTSARPLTQDDINAAVLKTLATTALPSAAAKAYELISPSVVRVVGIKLGAPSKKGQPVLGSERSVGTGVVIVDKGVILTNLHVVRGADSIELTFADGLTSTAVITGVQAENDLAVLQARTIPDDLSAATLRSTSDLQPGDQVMAVGFPFGIGPSASSGIVSGLQRTFKSPDGQLITNLIQFDAAANPGNSGGPLVTMDGSVVGIVTAIYNPNQQRTFVGIGFAVPIENAASAAGMPPF